MEHLISLSVGTKGVDDHAQTHQDLSELARNLGVTHNYVSVSSSVFGEDDEEADDAGCGLEHLHYDEDTLGKVRDALAKILVENQNARSMAAIITDCVNEMQNAGILFRERTPTKD